jgi:uncharacterized protein YbjQ (UPF0145 family)
VNIAGMSGNELYCLHLKGFQPGEIVVGNSVCSLGLVGGLGAWGRGITGGEVEAVTQLISEGRHAAIGRMEAEAQKHGAVGVTSVVSELSSMAGYTEFLSQGTSVSGVSPSGRFFSTAASGMEMYCHLDAGYHPIRFAMGNVAYALGLGRGLTGLVRTVGRGEVHEFSQMYNHIRHLALERLRKEAHGVGANAVVDVRVKILPYGPAAIELLLTGTASHHPALGALGPDKVVTSELTGEELWNLASLGLVPVQLVMATSVYSLGVVGGLGTMFKGMSRGELPELTSLVYSARENCLDLLRQEAEKCGADQVIGNKLIIREMSAGLVEVMAIGTAVRRVAGMQPVTPALIPQAIIVDRETMEDQVIATPNPAAMAANTVGRTAGQASAGARLIGVFIALFIVFTMGCGSVCLGVLTSAGGGH